ncbi:MAG: integrase [Deltaproteobacteria bacterium HGW-Deltaproteobacteria-12]|nr:MAG: integrase [Deltaproteobacteria bacterium HGW-Deltaproteobacteria-12]
MERKNLTIERIKVFSCPSGKAQAFLWDEDFPRLAVRVTSSGIKAFIFEGKLDKGQKNKKGESYNSTIRWTIGKTAAWTIDDARKEARRLQTLVDRGIDPREQQQAHKAEKAAKRAAIEANQKYTLKALLEAYTDHLDAQGKKKSASGARSVVKVHLLALDPALSGKPAISITSHDIAALIRQAREKGKERTAGILRSTISAAYNCGRRAPFDTKLPSEFIKFNINSNPVDPIPTIAVNPGNRTLTKDEIKLYMAALKEDTIDMALKLALCSGGQRMAELLRAEITDWNEDTKTLRLLDPKGKRRTPREHLLPLGPVASSIVSELVKRAKSKDTTLLFPSQTNKTPIDVSMPGPRVTEIAAAMGGEQFDLRDIRRTVETMLASLGVSRDIRAQLLSHGISGVQAQHYDRHDYMKEKRATLLKWERYLNRIASGEEENKVIPFQTRG